MTNTSQPEEQDSALVSSTPQNSDSQSLATPAYPSPRVEKVQRTFYAFLRWRQWPWILSLVAVWLAGFSAFQWLSKLPASANCGQLDAALSAGDRLDCADQKARQGDPESIASSLKLVSDWNPDHPLHLRASTLANQWSRSILVLAQRSIDKGDLETAVELANAVPKSLDKPDDQGRDVYDRAQRLIKSWKRKQVKGSEVLATARKEIKRQDWTQAGLAVRELVQLGDSYWQLQADQLLKDMSNERKAFAVLYQAQGLANSKRPKQIAKAIKIASKIDPKRVAYEKGQEDIAKWSQTLVDLAQKNLKNGRFDQAVAAASSIPPNVSVAEQATSLMQLGKAEAAAKNGNPLSYLQALALAQQVDAKEVGGEAKLDRVNQWEAQVQNFSQLQLAQLFANVDSVPAYQVAIKHAALVEKGSPQRDQAQTLIAHWTKQIDSYRDRQLMTQARQLAAAKTPTSYQAAIAVAEKIESGQPLYQDAQTLVKEWTDTVETIEDQPILDEARALAEKGDLNAAIQVARKVKSGRALYSEAQSDVGSWVAKIQIAEDQPILNRADSLASRGRLAEAISQARRIRSGRALYRQARGRINRWQGRLNAQRAAQQQREAARLQQQQRRQPQQRRRQPQQRRRQPSGTVQDGQP